MKDTAKYQEYHTQVVEACVKEFGEQSRAFFRDRCEFMTEFIENRTPEQVVTSQRQNFGREG